MSKLHLLPIQLTSSQPPKNNKKSGLGRALINRRAAEVQKSGTSPFHTTDMSVSESHKLRSVTHEGNLEEFLNTAQMADQDFTAERRNVTVITAPGMKRHNPYLLTEEEEEDIREKQDSNRGRLRVPRRPKWTINQTKEELDRSEKDSFLEWRRNLAELTDAMGFVLTPFERNLEVWRQLWRVIERSDLLVQIVDARNPMQFRCQDLEKYVSEMNDPETNPFDGTQEETAAAEAEGVEPPAARLAEKDRKRRNLLLINKADLLDEDQRRSWAKYFDTQGINYAFFSAANAAAIQAANEGEALQSVTTALSNLSVGGEEALLALQEAKDSKEASRVLTVEELEALFERSAPPPQERASATGHSEQGKLVVGLVGYPNVGKSSTINALIGSKKVSVSSTPGKTKHFQTLHLSDSTILCDCPGLVFPQFATTAAELVVDGILPIDQLREYTGPAELVAQRIPQDILESTYSFAIPTLTNDPKKAKANQTNGMDLLSAYAVSRGFTRQGQGNPDETRAARYVLKDYVNARLLFAHPPQGVDPDQFNAAQRDRIRAQLAKKGNKVHSLISDAVGQRVRTKANAPAGSARASGKSLAARQQAMDVGQDVDSAFFGAASAGPKIRGKLPAASLRGRVNNDGTIAEDADDVSSVMSGAPNGKKHFKGGKKKKQHNPNPYGV